MNKKTAIIMCTWKRPERLDGTLKSLLTQTDQDFSFYIWNNNVEIVDAVNNIVETYKDKLDINVVHSKENVGGFGRFLQAKEVVDEHEIIIFIDDDQDFNEHMVQTFVNEYDFNSLKSRWAWKLHPNSQTYRQRTKISTGGVKVNYCGTGGLVAPAWIFNTEEIYQIPKEFLFVEDLWLSYVADAILNLNITSIADTGFIRQNVDGKDQFNSILHVKDKFMNYLVNQKKWKII